MLPKGELVVTMGQLIVTSGQLVMTIGQRVVIKALRSLWQCWSRIFQTG